MPKPRPFTDRQRINFLERHGAHLINLRHGGCLDMHKGNVRESIDWYIREAKNEPRRKDDE